MYYTYIIKSQKDGSFYTGVTRNVEKRIKEHNQQSSSYSSSKTPFILVWYCNFLDRKKAYAFEHYLKTGSGIAFRNKHIV